MYNPREIRKSLGALKTQPVRFRSRIQMEWVKEYMPNMYEKSVKLFGDEYISRLPVRLNSDLSFIKSFIEGASNAVQMPLKIEKAKPRIGKKYAQQPGRKPGKGAGKIVEEEKKPKKKRAPKEILPPEALSSQFEGAEQELIKNQLVKTVANMKVMSLTPDVPEIKPEPMKVVKLTWKNGLESEVYMVEDKMTHEFKLTKKSKYRMMNEAKDSEQGKIPEEE